MYLEYNVTKTSVSVFSVSNAHTYIVHNTKNCRATDSNPFIPINYLSYFLGRLKLNLVHRKKNYSHVYMHPDNANISSVQNMSMYTSVRIDFFR